MTTTTTPAPQPVTTGDGLAGSRVLITGGTRGIGAATARRFTAAGATVVVAARSTPEQDSPALFMQADLSTPHGVQNLATQVLDELGGVDVLVDNAGSQTHVSAGAVAMTDQDWQRDLDTNLLSAVRLDRLLLPAMIEQRSGVIIHVTSGQARLPGPASLAYAAAKAAVTTYSKGLANQVGPHGIRVNTVVPGLIETAASVTRMDQIALATGTDRAAARDQMVQSIGIPLGRPGNADEVAELIAFLASDHATYITGSQYVIDGGLLPTT